MLGMTLGGFARRVGGVQAMSVGEMGMMAALFVIAIVIMLGGFLVMVSGLLVMLGGAFVMVLVIAHDCLRQVGWSSAISVARLFERDATLH